MLHWTVNLKGGWRTTAFLLGVSVKHKVYSFSWSNNDIEVHVFNTVSLDWMKLPPVITGRGERPPEVPSGRRGHTGVPIGDVIYIWGGIQQAKKCNRLYAFDVDTHRWLKTKVSGDVPEGRSYHSACVLGKVMYVHGGVSHQTNDYKLDTTSMVWSSIYAGGIPPSVSKFTSATIIGTKMFVFGGWANGTQYNHVSVFDTETNSWLKEENKGIHPEKCLYHSAFTYNGELYIIGGYDSTHLSTHLWRFNPESFSWKKVEPKGRRQPGRFGMQCCMVGDRLIVFGGWKYEHNKQSVSDDLLVLDMSPSLKTLCKLAVIQYRLEQSELPHDVRWELAAMTAKK